VVGPQLKGYGAHGLRVADGSIMPAIPSANAHTTIVMIGERAAEVTKAER
jgi:choline dehydrogenase